MARKNKDEMFDEDLISQMYPCPFCGSKEDLYIDFVEKSFGSFIAIKCKRCSVSLISSTTRHLVENWNRREYLANVVEEIFNEHK